MLVTATLFLVLAVLFSTNNRPLIPETLTHPQTTPHQYANNELRTVPGLRVPLLSMVTLPGLSETSINIPSIVPERETNLSQCWQVYLSNIPIPSAVVDRQELFPLIYVVSTLLVTTVTSFALLVVFALLICVWCICSSLVLCFVRPTSRCMSTTYFTYYDHPQCGVDSIGEQCFISCTQPAYL